MAWRLACLRIEKTGLGPWIRQLSRIPGEVRLLSQCPSPVRKINWYHPAARGVGRGRGPASTSGRVDTPNRVRPQNSIISTDSCGPCPL